MDAATRAALRASYDRVAGEYVERIFDELRHKPLDRALLDRFADLVRGQGLVCDMGCGPGHVARYLHERAVTVFGLDVSPGMIAQARRLSPEIEFRQGDMLGLDAPDHAWAAIVAFYSLIHVPRDAVVSALHELRRVLRPGGPLFLAFHVGDEVVHLDEWWGQPVSVDFAFFRTDEMEGYLRAAGFRVEESVERAPYEGVEHQSRRACVLASRPAEGEAP